MPSAQTSRTDEPLDTSIRLVTPERITFQYPLAGPFRRTMAYLLDFLVWVTILLVVTLAANFFAILSREAADGIFLAALFILQWGYGGFCEGLFNGQTPGKKALGIRVVSVDGVPITGGQAVLRNLLWTFEWVLPLAFMPALISMLLTRRFQRLGDLAAGTMVVVERRAEARGRDPPVGAGHRGRPAATCRRGSRPGRNSPGPWPTTSSIGSDSTAPVARRWPSTWPGRSAPATASRPRRPATPSCAPCITASSWETEPMRVVDRLAQRQESWQELDRLVRRLGGLAPAKGRRKNTRSARVVRLDESDFTPEGSAPKRPRGRARYASDDVLRLGELYRAACADLMLAEAHDLPRDTVAYLHDLVARAHNVVYRGRGFNFRAWAGDLLAEVPRRLRADPTLRVSALVFYGSFLIFGLIGAARPELAAKVAGESKLEMYEQMYAERQRARPRRELALHRLLHQAQRGHRPQVLRLGPPSAS